MLYGSNVKLGGEGVWQGLGGYNIKGLTVVTENGPRLKSVITVLNELL
jgi:hypothetical protein